MADHGKDEATPVTRTVTALDWSGLDDSENPRNFSLRRRLISTAAVTFLAFVSTIAGSIYSPGIDDVARQFDVRQEVAILPLSMYNLGLAFGPLVGAPLSEQYGRKAVFMSTTPVFALFILGSGFSKTPTSLIICRFFAGVFASPAISNASATITDFTAGRYRAISLAFYYSIPYFGAVFAPLMGGFIVESKGWRWTQWTVLFFACAFYLPVVFGRETYKKTILMRRAKRLGMPGPVPVTQGMTVLQSIRYFARALLFRPVHMLFTEPIVTLVCLYNGFMFGLMYTFVVASPWVYQYYYNFSTQGQSLSFLGLISGTLIAPFPLIMIDLNVYQRRLRKFYLNHSEGEQFPPENRLVPAQIFSPILPVGLLVFAWTAAHPKECHWIIPIIFQAVVMGSSVVIYSSANLYMIDSYGPLYAASASGAAMLTRYTLSFAFPLFALQMFKSLGVGWATTILAGVSVALGGVPWVFWIWGEGLRKKGKYETST